MQAQEERDRKTVAIARAIGLFLLILGVGAAALAILYAIWPFSDGVGNALGISLIAVAGFALVAYLARADRLRRR